VRRIGLIGAHLLGGDDEVEVEGQVAPRLAEQLVVDVGDEPRLELLGELRQLRVGLLERGPALDGVGQEAGARRLERPADVLGDPDGHAAQDLGVELVGAAFDLALVLVEAGDDLLRILDREAVARGLLLKGVEDSLFPIDQGAVDVERYEVDLGRERHAARIVPFDRRSTPRGRPWAGRRKAGVSRDEAGCRSRGLISAAAMDLLEYQGKQLFARHDIPVPDGRPARTVDEAVSAAKEIGFPCVVKAQVKIGGRGKAGGIKVAQNEDEAREAADAILGMDIRGFTVHEVWVEGASEIAAEYYASIIFDRSAKQPLIMLSTRGGMDIEAVAEEEPGAIATLHVDPLLGFQDFHGRRLAFEAGVDADLVRPIGAFLHRLYGTFVSEEAMLVEVNPLIVTPDRAVRALDAKVTLDDNALMRHPDNAELRDPSAEDPQEQMAKERGLTYVSLDGDIGVLGNGAGLVMSTLDVVAQYGGKPANFLDAGGGSKAEAITSAVEVILANPNVKAVLFNIFGGITRCDEVANGLVEAFNQIEPSVPFVVRLDGTNDEEGRRILAEAQLSNVHTAATMNEAAEKVVELAR
jgi:succinyl-CoA synthetase beta subunit